MDKKSNRELALDYAIALGDLNVRAGMGDETTTSAHLIDAARRIEAYLNERPASARGTEPPRPAPAA